MGIWGSLVPIAIFSVLVIAADEWMHSRRRRRRRQQRRPRGVVLVFNRNVPRSRVAGLRGRRLQSP